MTKKLREVSEQNDLLECQYNTYVSDVIKLQIYFRGLFDDEDIQKYVEEKYPDMYQKVLEILDRE